VKGTVGLAVGLELKDVIKGIGYRIYILYSIKSIMPMESP